MYRLFETTPGEFNSTKEGWIRLIHPQDVRQASAAAWKAVVDDTPMAIEYRIVRHDSTIGIIESVGTPIHDKNGKVDRMIGIVRDITQRRTMEEERVQALSMAEEKERKRAEEAEKYRTNLENFINQICHEIRNPMCGIFGNVDISQNILSSMKPALD